MPAGELARFVEEPFRGELVARFKSLGFKFVANNMEGFRSGGLNAMLPADKLQVIGRKEST